METDHAITTTPPSSTTLTGGHTKGLDPGIIALCSLVVVGLFALLTWLFGSGVCRKPIKQCVNKYCPGCLKTADVENPQSSSSQQQNRDSSECERLEVHGQTHQGSAEDLVPGTGSPNDETDRSTLLNQTRSSDRHTERSEISEGNHSIETTTSTPVVNAEIHGQTLQGSADDLIPVTSSPSEISALLNQTRSSDSLTERSELIEGEQTLTSRTDEMDIGNGRFPPLGNILTNEYFMDLAQEIGTEWKDLAIRLEFSKAEIERIIERERDIKYRTLEILQCWHQRTSNIDMGRKVEILCKALMKCGREDLSDKVKADAERCS
ncbi:uncharacterized protein LOC121423115 isoform X3 [Lytechinus variegatus]|uniref:uncharacterized protein LOC121423115 isoform X3 n=1 Tax=Lytechinus variegatus TaxID=7654 RepID=UPI001BB24F0A|nr:uncharacterized protein LOC121423115 isoform X3 [Lytechinus variegatus]